MCNFIKNIFFILKSRCNEVIYVINIEKNLCICYILLTVLLTEDPGTEALCSLAGKGLCKGRGTQWVCVLCPHTEKNTLSSTHFHFDVCFLVYFIHPYVPFEWWHTWPFRGYPAPPRAPGQPQLLAPSLSKGGEPLVVGKERSKAALVPPSGRRQKVLLCMFSLTWSLDWNCCDFSLSSIWNSPEPTAPFIFS